MVISCPSVYYVCLSAYFIKETNERIYIKFSIVSLPKSCKEKLILVRIGLWAQTELHRFSQQRFIAK